MFWAIVRRQTEADPASVPRCIAQHRRPPTNLVVRPSRLHLARGGIIAPMKRPTTSQVAGRLLGRWASRCTRRSRAHLGCGRWSIRRSRRALGSERRGSTTPWASPLPAAAPTARPTTNSSDRPPISTSSTSAGPIDRASIGLIAPPEIRMRCNPFLIDRRGANDRFHRRSNSANQLVPDLLLIIEPADRRPEPQHSNDLKPAISLNKCRRAITTVLV